MEIRPSVNRLLQWRNKRISDKQLLLILSLVVGLLTGLAAVLLKNAVFYLRIFLVKYASFSQVNFLILVYPLIGILLTYMMVRYWFRENITHGISRILQSISQSGGRMKRHDTYSSMAGSAVTVGFGGSVGLEAPIVATGSAIGSNIGQLLKLDTKSIIVLIGCGAAGAIAGIFRAPVAGVVFAMEVLMLDVTMSSLIPLLISAVTGATIAGILMGHQVLFAFELTETYHIRDLPYYLLLGVLCGLISLYFTRVNYYIEGLFERWKNPWSKAILGGLVLSILVFLFPPLFGEGYSSLYELLSGNGKELLSGSFLRDIPIDSWYFIAILLAVLLLKVITMSVTTGAGGVGGVFAPALFVGGMTGFFMTSVFSFFHLGNLSAKNFSLVGMAGMLAGVMHAPLTAIFLIAEMTDGYALLIPLMITATIAFITMSYYEPHSVYTKGLAEKGQLPSRNKDKSTLAQMKIDDIIETNFNTIGLNDYLGDLVREVSRSQRNVFPVIDKENNFYGVVFINDIRPILFKQELYGKMLVKELMYMPDTLVEVGEDMEDVAQKFHDTQHYNLPVLDKGKYIGFISRAHLFSVYREKMKEALGE
jgi:CIC family chloride channel protein